MEHQCVIWAHKAYHDGSNVGYNIAKATSFADFLRSETDRSFAKKIENIGWTVFSPSWEDIVEGSWRSVDSISFFGSTETWNVVQNAPGIVDLHFLKGIC